MKLLARALIFFIVIYAVLFPLSVGVIKARKTIFPSQFRVMVKDAAKVYRLDPLLVAAIIYSESSFRTKAISKSGAIGLMQIMPETARQMARECQLKQFKIEDLFDPKVNLSLGCYYLFRLGEEFGDLQHILIAYNAGRNNLKRWMTEGDILSNTYPETRHYVIKVKSVYWLLKLLDHIKSF